MPMVWWESAAGRFPTPREPRANMGDLNILSRPVCWSVIARTNKYAGSRYILKPDELSIPGQLARSKSAEVRVASGDLKRPLAFWSTDRADRRDQLFEGSQGGTPCPVIWCCASYPTGYYLAQNGGRSSSSAAAHSPGKLLKWKKPPLNLIPKSGKSNQNRFT